MVQGRLWFLADSLAGFTYDESLPLYVESILLGMLSTFHIPAASPIALASQQQ